MKLSNVIPTHNRCDALALHLSALANQTLSPSSFEVIVVMDQCADDTRSFLSARAGSYPYNLCILETPSGRHGVSAARNIGVENAKSDLIAFTDDDIIPNIHSFALFDFFHGPRQVLIGNMPCLVDPTHRHLGVGRDGYMDFVTQHVAVMRADFEEAGRFDEDLTLYGAEDFDLGLRLLANACLFTFIEGAHCLDLDTPYAGDPKTREQKRIENAQNEALLRQKHGEWPYGPTRAVPSQQTAIN